MKRLIDLLNEVNEYHIKYIERCKLFKIRFNRPNEYLYSLGLNELDAVLNTKMSVRRAKKISSIDHIEMIEDRSCQLPIFICDILGKDSNCLKNSPWLYLVNPKSHLYTELYYLSDMHHIPLITYNENISYSFDDYDVKFNLMIFGNYSIFFITEKIRNVSI